MKTLDFPMEVKSLTEAGAFTGYASVFDNVDQGGDVIEKGAFKEFVRTRDGKTLVLFQHNSREPIGKATVTEDKTGLLVDGHLMLEDPVARRAHNGMKGGLFDAMSIGYDVLPNGSEIQKSGVRVLKALKLWEVSVVTFGMNELARIESVKHAENIKTIREFEDFLRDAGGFSIAQAKLIASGGFKSLQTLRDAGNPDGVQQMIDRINNISLPTI